VVSTNAELFAENGNHHQHSHQVLKTIDMQHKRGINLELVKFWMTSLDGDLTTSDVVTQVVIPLTEVGRCCLCQMLLDVEFALPDEAARKARRRPVVAPPTHFVSHAFGFKFRQTIDAVDAWCNENNVPASNLYIWIDVFTLNQHSELPGQGRTTHADVATSFKRSVKQAGHTLFVSMPPGHSQSESRLGVESPLAKVESLVKSQSLSRCWCLYEIMQSHEAGVKFDVCLQKRARAQFQNACVENYDVREYYHFYRFPSLPYNTPFLLPPPPLFPPFIHRWFTRPWFLMWTCETRRPFVRKTRI
jgi:hypothetical protein